MASFVWVVDGEQRFNEVGCPHCGDIDTVLGLTTVSFIGPRYDHMWVKVRHNKYSDKIEIDPHGQTETDEPVGVVGDIESLSCTECNWKEHVYNGNINFQVTSSDVLHDRYYSVTGRHADKNQMSIYDAL